MALLTSTRKAAAYFGAAVVVCGALALVVIAGYRLWAIPAWYLQQHPGTDAQAINEYRLAMGPVFAALVQAVAGFIVIVGLGLTWREWRTNRETALAEEFSRAIDALASETCEVRLSAVYRLERVATESRRDYEAIHEVLFSFIKRRLLNRGHEDRLAQLPDVCAALSVVGRLRRAHAKSIRSLEPLDLTGADLRNISLPGAYLARARLSRADLSGADLTYATLDGADLSGARIVGAKLISASLRDVLACGADFRMSDLSRADLRYARLVNVCARNANFRFAHIHGTTLEGDFGGASLQTDDFCWLGSIQGDFRGADLRMHGAEESCAMAARICADERTRLPDNWAEKLPTDGPYARPPKCALCSEDVRL